MRFLLALDINCIQPLKYDVQSGPVRMRDIVGTVLDQRHTQCPSTCVVWKPAVTEHLWSLLIDHHTDGLWQQSGVNGQLKTVRTVLQTI